ncbi:Uncharacterized OB-fold protein, contains Zn-ribbon domain [Roseovarius lutimaris]|uniref:Uncharacterized OB-fold protein, contains Zn-ribbon domain n=1 Tax=Roseovarius lutimaris TaxID=1005928 RepID=A0A1I5GQ66_9RHOB|nr:zinc ribbon domain-containing protein [Roseovarius lutimaris]SFO38122.1 Uncharacterized OB-fold protein, contains Zn-ribbon domain [Roseovarius lutimaris]
MSTQTALSVDLTLSLTYHHGFGALSPFLTALQQGSLVGSRCPACGDVRFPPRRVCLHDGDATEPHQLDSTGQVIRVTVGSVPIPLSEPAQDRIFAEIAVDGTNNRVLARLSGDPTLLKRGARVRLVPPSTTKPPHPIQALIFEPIEGTLT